MHDTVLTFANFDELRNYVHDTLCLQDALDPKQCPLVHTVLTRSGRPCGLVFHVEGPRLLRTTAVWSADDARVLFYDSTGKRVGQSRLLESPTVEALAPKRIALAA